MKKVAVIVGPTAVGKTELSVMVAQKYQCEIISGDSVQVYRGLDVGSAKIKEEEKQGIHHHLIDILNPGEFYDVAQFQKEARRLIDNVERPLIVGGTGLYIKACLDDYDFQGKKRDADFESAYERFSNEELHALLQEKDAHSANKIHPNNRRRILRAIALSEEIKRSERTKKDIPLYEYHIFYLTLPREQLYERINARVDQMMNEGFLEEVKALKEKGHTFNIIGYRELNEYLDGLYSLEESIDEIKKVTRRFAKRQETFFENQMHTHMIVNDEYALNKIYDILDGFWG